MTGPPQPPKAPQASEALGQSVKRLAKRWWVAFFVVVFVGFGAYSLEEALGWVVVLAALVVALLAAFVRFNEIAGRVVGGIVVGLLVLVGVNVLVDNVHRLPILSGLFLAVVVFGLAAGWYLRGYKLKKKEFFGRGERWRLWTTFFGRGERWGLWTTFVVAAALSIFLLVDVPIIVERKEKSVTSMLIAVVPALVLFGIGVWCKLKKEGVGNLRLGAGFAMPVLGLLVMAVVPVVREQGKEGGGKVPQLTQVASKVDVRVVTDGSAHPAPPHVDPDPALRGFEVTYSVGFAVDNDVRWTLVGERDADTALQVASRGKTAQVVDKAPVTRVNADPVLVLLVDGTAPVIDGQPRDLKPVKGTDGEVGRWRRIGHAAREPLMPMYALLQTERPKRLRQWEHFTTNGAAISLQMLGRRAVTDAGLGLGIAAPTADADLSLAVTHRPVLLFDKTEPVPRPLSIEWLFSSDLVHLCHDRGVTKTECDEEAVHDSSTLENGGTHLQLDRPDSDRLKRIAQREAREAEKLPEAPTPDAPGAAPVAALASPTIKLATGAEDPETAIYVHAVPISKKGKLLLFLDYWWYLPENPVNIGHKVFCGAGLVIPGITCHNHESDWEGMTVVIDRTTSKPRVTSVQYAEHDAVVSFPWPQLRAYWDASPTKVGKTTIVGIVERVDKDHERPLAFIASGTHATYPKPCSKLTSSKCTQFASGTGEDPHDGSLPWIGNYSNVCGNSSCVHRLPTSEGGRQPALWNAFTGTWGDRHCALTYYCDSASPPAAPGNQGRYKHPTRCSGVGDGWTFNGKERCDD